MAKKVVNLATEEYVNEMIENIELTQGPVGETGADGKSAYQTAVEQGFEGTEEEWLQSLKGEAGKFDMETLYDILETEDKTVIGAINELFQMINNWMKPEYNIKAQMFYGIIDPTETGIITTYEDITIDMLNNVSGVKSTKPGERLTLSLGYVDEGSYIVVAVPALYDFIVTKDNGFGGKIEFDDSVIGANGLDVEFEGVDYRIYGEFVLVGGERFIYIEKPEVEENPGGNCCECPDISIDDIKDILNDSFDEE